MVKYPALNVF